MISQSSETNTYTEILAKLKGLDPHWEISVDLAHGDFTLNLKHLGARALNPAANFDAQLAGWQETMGETCRLEKSGLFVNARVSAEVLSATVFQELLARPPAMAITEGQIPDFFKALGVTPKSCLMPKIVTGRLELASELNVVRAAARTTLGAPPSERIKAGTDFYRSVILLSFDRERQQRNLALLSLAVGL